MRKLMLCVFAVLPFAVLVVVSSSASAAFEYLCGGEAILTSGNCLTHYEILGTLSLTDMSLGAGVTCAAGDVTGEDEIISPTVDLITSIVFKEKGQEPSCTHPAKVLNLKNEEVTNACTKLEEVEPIALPWETKIEEEASVGDWWILIVPVTAGYATLCESLLGLVEDKCTMTAGHTLLVLAESLGAEEIEKVSVHLMSIVFTEELLEKEGTKEPESGKCSLGGAESWLISDPEVLFWGLIAEKPASLEIS